MKTLLVPKETCHTCRRLVGVLYREPGEETARCLTCKIGDDEEERG
jgi:hypothetical protein